MTDENIEMEAFRKVPGQDAPIRRETPIEAMQRRRTYGLEAKIAVALLIPGKPKFVKDPINAKR